MTTRAGIYAKGFAAWLAFGAVWLVLTLVFELSVFHFALGEPMDELLAAFDLPHGRLWPLFLLTLLATPPLAARRVD